MCFYLLFSCLMLSLSITTFILTLLGFLEHTTTNTNEKFQVVCFLSFSLPLLKGFNFWVYELVKKVSKLGNLFFDLMFVK